MSEQDIETVHVDDLREDLAGIEKRIAEIANQRHVEGKHVAGFLQSDLVPLLGSLVEKVSQQEDALLSVFEEGELLMPETAATLLSALEAGDQLAAFCERATLTDVQRAEASKLVAQYRAVRQLAEKVVQDLVDEEEAEEAGEGEGEGEGEAGESEGAQ